MTGSTGTSLETKTLWVVLFTSRADGNVAEWTERFDRYRRVAGRDLRVTALDVSRPLSALLPASDAPAVLWDVSAGVPPKEIEVLLAGWQAGEWRVGTRCAHRSIARKDSALARWSAWFAGMLRRGIGQISDPQPPCVAAAAYALAQTPVMLAQLPSDRWTSETVRVACRHRGVQIREVPVMWSGQAAASGSAR